MGQRPRPQGMPYAASQKVLKEWVRAEVVRGVPLGALCRVLMEDSDSETLLRRMNVSDSLDKVIVDRNQKGTVLERAAKLDQAVRLYEANVSDEDPGSHSYDRLVRIYGGLGKWLDVIRVCSAFLAFPGLREEARAPFEKRRLEAATHFPPPPLPPGT